MYTKAGVAKKIDHAVLKPTATDDDVVAAARMCVRRAVGNLCVRPTDVALAAATLRGTDTTVAAVIGFPHGSHRSEAKALEARLAVEDGADELDIVMNIGKFLSGDEEWVRKELDAVIEESRPHGVLTKIILETCFLDPKQIERACRIAAAAGADYVKTSTGFGSGPATPEAVAIMIRTVGNTLGVKASGGIRSWNQAVAYLDQGCQRLGLSSTEAVLDGAPA